MIAIVGSMRYRDTGEERIDSATLGDPASLRSLVGVPVRVGHGGRTVGVVRSARLDGGKLLATMTIDDPDVRAQVRDGSLVELSPGYDRDLSLRNEQRNRRYFELAILPKGAARCGSSCSIVRADSQDEHLGIAEIARRKMINSYPRPRH